MARLRPLEPAIGVQVPAPQSNFPSDLHGNMCSCLGTRRFEAREAIATSLTYSEALRRMGLRAAGGNHRTLKKWVERWGIPTDHFDPDAARRAFLRHEATPLEDVLVEHSTYHRGKLKERLFAEGLKERGCELCGQDEIWRGRRMALILDHINGVFDDNRLGNLQIVCPNCAATLDTHCGRKLRRLEDERRCLRCDRPFRPRHLRHRYCSRECGQRSNAGRTGPRPEARKVQRPPYEQLLAETRELGFSATGRKYGVSDNAVRKWLRAYERDAGPPTMPT